MQMRLWGCHVTRGFVLMGYWETWGHGWVTGRFVCYWGQRSSVTRGVGSVKINTERNHRFISSWSHSTSRVNWKTLDWFRRFFYNVSSGTKRSIYLHLTQKNDNLLLKWMSTDAAVMPHSSSSGGPSYLNSSSRDVSVFWYHLITKRLRWHSSSFGGALDAGGLDVDVNLAGKMGSVNKQS